MNNPFIGDTQLPADNSAYLYNRSAALAVREKGLKKVLADDLLLEARKGKYLTDHIKLRVSPEMLAEKLSELVNKGNLEAIKIVLDRVEGKPKETVEIGSTVNPIVKGLEEYLKANELHVVKTVDAEIIDVKTENI